MWLDKVRSHSSQKGAGPRQSPLWFPLNSHPLYTCPENMFQSKSVYLIFQDYFPCVSFPYFHIELTEQFKVLRMVKLQKHERYFIRNCISSEDETVLYQMLYLLLFPGLKKKRLSLLRSPRSQHSSTSDRCLHWERLPLKNQKITKSHGLYLQILHCLPNQPSCFQISTCQSKPCNRGHDWFYWYLGAWL